MNSESSLPTPPDLPGPTPFDPSEHRMDIAIYIILTIVTCGFFNIYWNYRQMLACNAMLGREEFRFWTWALLSFITCGIYHLYYQYQMGTALVEIQRSRSLTTFDNLPIISILVSIFGLSIVVDAIHQHEINKIVG